MNNASKIIILIIIVAVAAGGFFYFNGRTNEVAPQNIEAAETIIYDGAAFAPATVRIKVGESVAFVNRGSAGMWVASAPHPTHADYPEFDAKKAYGPGETYVFTFMKEGTWKFHNHLNATTGFGSIVVEQ